MGRAIAVTAIIAPMAIIVRMAIAVSATASIRPIDQVGIKQNAPRCGAFLHKSLAKVSAYSAATSSNAGSDIGPSRSIGCFAGWDEAISFS